MARVKARRIIGIGLVLVLLVAALGAFFFYRWIKRETAPTAKGASYYVRYRQQTNLQSVFEDLEKSGVIRNATAFKYYAMLKRVQAPVPVGTFQFHPGMSADEILRTLRKPISQMVRIPETNFSFRTARLLQRHGVLVADEYKDLIKKPDEFKPEVKFPLPKFSLEGYLYPDTYDLPPLLGAHDTIERQLQAFQEKAWPKLQGTKDVNKVLTIASMVEMEAAKDKDRPLIAGVIINRLNKGIRLQIDATVLYGMGKWKPRLTFADYTNTISDYNTYLHNGLPPGPICSPSMKSIEAALFPAKHNYIFYVALPSGYSLFAATYPEHLANIAKRKAALAQLKKPSPSANSAVSSAQNGRNSSP